jgi:hypothetical protein
MLMTTQRPEQDALDIFYRRLAVALSDLKVRLQAQYERRFPGQGMRIREAIEEAEVAAWHTSFPHLFFPDLAEEAIARLAVASASGDKEDGASTFANVA